MKQLMPERIEILHQEAKDLFLGKGNVVGVGIADDSGQGELAFLVRDERRENRAEILGWASKNHIGVEFLSTDAIRVKEL